MNTPERTVLLRKILIHRFHPANRVPTVTINMDARADAAIRLKDALGAGPGGGGPKVTLNHIIIKAAAMALGNHPIFNSDFDGRRRVYKNATIDIRTPVDLGDFPVHVVIPETDRKDLFEIASVFSERLRDTRSKVEGLRRRFSDPGETGRLKIAAFDAFAAFARRMRPLFPPWERYWFSIQHRLMGTFMVTNMGTLGVTDCHGQLVKPSTGALLVMALKNGTAGAGGAAGGKLLPLALEYDPRIVSASEAGAFLSEIVSRFEDAGAIDPRGARR
jgi:pyruvate/2-oxoglutarate dehydrogenase complex dihydrolipoamide acyltransferase (E2) component